MRPICFALAFALLLVPLRARGDASPDVRALAKQHYEAGETAYHLGELDRAISEWRQSYELSKVPLLLYDLGQAYRQKGDTKQALFFYKQYLSVAPMGESRDVAEKQVAELNQVLAAQQNGQNAPPQGPASPPLPTAQTAAPQSVESVQRDRPRRRSWVKDPGVWIGFGVGVAGVAIGGALLGLAAHEGDLASNATTSSEFNRHHANDLNDQKGGWPLLAIGATSLVVGGVVVAIDVRRKGQ
jgi:tetratricopeptide (TPR) repeat protein